MKKIEAAVTAYAHASTIAKIEEAASAAFGVERHIGLSSAFDWLLGDANIKMGDVETAAERLFDFAMHYKYGPEILCRQQQIWLDRSPIIEWCDVDDVTRLRYSIFHATAHALAPFVDKPEAEPKAPRPPEPGRGFERMHEGDDAPGARLDDREDWVKPARTESMEEALALAAKDEGKDASVAGGDPPVADAGNNQGGEPANPAPIELAAGGVSAAEDFKEDLAESRLTGEANPPDHPLPSPAAGMNNPHGTKPLSGDQLQEQESGDFAGKPKGSGKRRK